MIITIQIIGSLILTLLLLILTKYVKSIDEFIKNEFDGFWGKFTLIIAIFFWPWTVIAFTTIALIVLVTLTVGKLTRKE